ncbi:MAG TPA: GAF domain-containing sensor histidine kinase [Candidatus Limnocylindrales bacterium]|nr:GAF domain-containing sensor histidine kinase [Candidatus Limnocylindrales bacterium]
MAADPPSKKAGKASAGVAPSRLRVLAGGAPTPAPSFRLLTQVSAALSTSLDLDTTLREVLEKLNTLVAFDAATLFLLDDSGKELQVKAALGVPVALAEVKRFKVGEGVVGWVVEHGATALIENSSKDARFQETGAQRRPRTVLAAPLRARHHVFGALVLVRSPQEPFTADHQRLCEAIAGQAAVAIDHARLYETERASRRRAEALLLIAEACSDAVTMPELLERAVKQVAFAMRATAAVIVQPDPQARVIQSVWETPPSRSSDWDALLRQPIDAIPLGRALRGASAPIVIARPDPALPATVWERVECPSLVAVPIRWQGELLAALVVGFKGPFAPEGAALELLDELGRQIALGMERLRLQQQVQEQQNDMAVVAERNRIARDLHDGIVQYVYALGLSLEHARDLVAPDPQAAALALSRGIEQVNHVLSEMRTFIYQLRPIIMKQKEVGEWVLDLCRQFQLATGVTIEAEVGETGGHELSPEISIALFRIIQEALSNIYQHARASRATLSLRFDGSGVSLLIADDGAGFTPAERPAPRIAGGHGLGNIEERVAELNGVLRIQSAIGHGTRLEADIPYTR